MHSLLGPLLWLALILIAIPVSLVLLKRSPLGAHLSGISQEHLSVVSSLNIGPGQRVVTLQVLEGSQKRWLILGVTANSMTTIHSMAAPAVDESSVADVSAKSPAFDAVLRRLQGTHKS